MDNSILRVLPRPRPAPPTATPAAAPAPIAPPVNRTIGPAGSPRFFLPKDAAGQRRVQHRKQRGPVRPEGL